MDDKTIFEGAKIQIIGITRHPDNPRIGPEELSAYGAMGCFKEASSYEMIQEDFANKTQEELDKKKVAVLKNSAGMGHGSVLDQNYFIFSISNLTRAATHQLCLPNYLAHLQQSLRRANADRGFYLPPVFKDHKSLKDVKDILTQAFELYEKMTEKGVPAEDARYILPLYTKTTIQTGGDARELIHLLTLNEQGEVPSAVTDIVNGMKEQVAKYSPNILTKWGHNYETLAFYPAPILFSSKNVVMNEIINKYNSPDKATYVEYEVSEEIMDRAIRERNETDLSMLKHVHNGSQINGILTPLSIACYHQATRQRTWDQALESIYDAAEVGNHIVPPTVQNSEYVDEFKKMANDMISVYKQTINEGIERKEAIGIVPNSLSIYDLIHINGWNMIHSMGKRLCTEAQWEIRIIAQNIANELRKRNSKASKYLYPQGVIYGKCPERVSCGLCDKILENMKKKEGEP